MTDRPTDVLVLDILTRAYEAYSWSKEQKEQLQASVKEFVTTDDDREVLLRFCRLLLVTVHAQIEGRLP